MPEPLTLQWFAVWAAVVAVVAVDVSKTKVFAWLRRWLDGKPVYGRRTARAWRFGADLVKCPWCLSHWLAAGVCLGHGLWNPLWWLALTGASAVPMMAYCGLLWLLEDERLSCD